METRRQHEHPITNNAAGSRDSARGAEMKRKAVLAGVLSLLVPGLGQMVSGRSEKGATILAAAIVIGSLNVLFVLAFSMANPEAGVVWAYWIPRVGHDVLSVWSVAFWLWAVVDAYRDTARQNTR